MTKEDIKKQYEESRASLMTQLFIMIATANGAGLATILSSLGQLNSQTNLTPYLIGTAAILGIGSFSILLSGFIRFKHSKLAERQSIAKLNGKTRLKAKWLKLRTPLEFWYKFLMKVSVASLFLAVSIFLYGSFHLYDKSRINCELETPNKALQPTQKPRG